VKFFVHPALGIPEGKGIAHSKAMPIEPGDQVVIIDKTGKGIYGRSEVVFGGPMPKICDPLPAEEGTEIHRDGSEFTPSGIRADFELTPKLKAFVGHSHACGRAHEAARRAGLEFAAEPIGYYVYVLVDTRHDQIFYVGKGKDGRRHVHRKYAHNLKDRNARKVRRILDVLDSGHEVLALIVENEMCESVALEQERRLIGAIGKELLLNHSPGVVTDRERARTLLSRVKNFAAWKAEVNPDKESEALYWTVVKGLQHIANRPDGAIPFDAWFPERVEFKDGYAFYPKTA
jgi:hypothetical protein